MYIFLKFLWILVTYILRHSILTEVLIETQEWYKCIGHIYGESKNYMNVKSNGNFLLHNILSPTNWTSFKEWSIQSYSCRDNHNDMKPWIWWGQAKHWVHQAKCWGLQGNLAWSICQRHLKSSKVLVAYNIFHITKHDFITNIPTYNHSTSKPHPHFP